MIIEEVRGMAWESFKARLALAGDHFSTNNALIRQIQIATGDETITRLEAPKHAEAQFKIVWDACFGEHGYLLKQDAQKVEQDKQMVLNSYLLAEWAHRDQRRDSGQPYILHPAEILVGARGMAGLLKHKPTAEMIAAAWLHDVPEDTSIGLDIIRDFVGVRPSEIVDIVTQVKKTQKMVGGDEVTVKQREDTMLKILRAVKNDPEAIIIKIFDRMHNMATIKTLRNNQGEIDKAKQLAYATDTFNTYVRLAHMMGLHDEAEWLTERCIGIIDPQTHRDKLLAHIQTDHDEYYKDLDLSAIQKDVLTTLDRMPTVFGIRHMAIVKPKPYEILAQMGRRRVLTDKDMYLTIKMVIDDTTTFDSSFGGMSFEYRATQIAHDLLFAQRQNGQRMFFPPPTNVVGIVDAIEIAQQGDTRTFTLQYMQDGKIVPIILEVSSFSEFGLQTVPLSYLYASEDVALNNMPNFDSGQGVQDLYSYEEFVIFAQLKYQMLQTKFEMVDRQKELSREEKQSLIDQLLTVLPGRTIDVIGVYTKNDEAVERLTPVAEGSTVADYAAQKTPGPLLFINPNSIEINGKRATFATVLKPKDRIHYEFLDNVEITDVSALLDALVVERDRTIFQVARKINGFIESGINGNVVQSEQAAELKALIIRRGETALATLVSSFGEYSYKYVADAFPHNNWQDFLYQLGLELALGSITQKDVDQTVEKLQKYWKSMKILAVKVEDRQGIDVAVTTIISGKLNIIHRNQRVITGVVYDSANQTFSPDSKDIWLVYRFRPQEKIEDVRVIGEVLQRASGITRVDYFEDDNNFKLWIQRMDFLSVT